MDHVDIVGVPDVVFFNPRRERLYVAIGDPGVIEVLETTPLRRREVVATERGAHTLAFDGASETPATRDAIVARLQKLVEGASCTDGVGLLSLLFDQRGCSWGDEGPVGGRTHRSLLREDTDPE
jgi:hypothetical protein